MVSGTTFDERLDGSRLRTQQEAVFELMQDGLWRTLAEIRIAIGQGSEAGISARLRDLRKPKFGSLTVQRQRRGDSTVGLFEYRLGN